jgi:hypothetical protein
MRTISSSLTFLALLALAVPAAAQVRTPSPVIERIEPTSGPVGTVVQIVGRFFRAEQTVLLGETELPVTTRLPNRWTVTIPAGATRGHVRVRIPDGTTIDGPEFRVTAAPAAPTISGITPPHAPPGAEVRIAGDGFSPRITENIVTLGGLPVVVRTAAPTELVVIVPTGATTGSFVVRVAASGEVTSPAFTVDVGVQVTSFTPTVVSPGGRVTITGTGYAPRAAQDRVFINGTAARIVSATETSIVIDVPAAATTGTILVDVRGGGRAYSAAALTVQPAPTITSVDPVSGVVGATIHIVGTGFGTDIRQVAATIHGSALTIRNLTPTDITAEIPAGAVTDRISVVVNGLPPVLSPSFSVLTPVTVASFAPETGGPGTEVRIAGAGFSPAAGHDRVTLAGVECPVLAATATELRVRIPSATSGPLVVEVRNAGSARTTRPFVVTTPPFVARFEPASGTPGAVVRITGTGFGTTAGIVEVTFGGRAAPIRSITDTQIEAAVPSGATTGRIGVTVRLQGSSTSTTDFVVLNDLSVARVDPTTAYPGQTITLHGVGLATPGLTVTFTGSRAAATLGAATTNELRVVVPGDAATGPITVRSSDGRTVPTDFTLAPTPTGVGITEVVPECTHPGCTVVVRGYGFAARATGQTVTVGGARARVRRATPYELTFTIPPRLTGSVPLHIDVRGVGAIDGSPLALTTQ